LFAASEAMALGWEGISASFNEQQGSLGKLSVMASKNCKEEQSGEMKRNSQRRRWAKKGGQQRESSGRFERLVGTETRGDPESPLALDL